MSRDGTRAPTGSAIRGTRLFRRLRLAGFLVLAGLAVEAVTLLWSHHLAFVLFLGLGGLLIAAGVLLYLWSLISSDSTPKRGTPPAAPR
jgi:predicted membrane channel-forming protein YqfA (hemolysin III family)